MELNRQLAAVVSSLLVLFPLTTLAEFEYIAGSELGWMQINVNDEQFHPIVVNAYFDMRHSSGFGTELLLATGVIDDQASQVELELDRHAAAYATYSTRGQRVILTLGAGYSQTKLNASLRDGPYPGNSTYEGGTFFFRFTEELRSWPDWHASLAFYSFFDNSDIDIWSANLGVQYAF